MMANINNDKRRKLMRWRLLDHLRDEIDPNKVIDNWVIPLENYRDIADRNADRLPKELADQFKDILASDGPYHDSVLCEFGDLTRWMLAYYGDVTTNLFPDVVDRVDAEKAREKEAESRKRLKDSTARLLNVLNTEPEGR